MTAEPLIKITDEMVAAAEAHVAPLEEQDDTRKAIAAVLAIVERDRPNPVEAMKAAYWKLRGHATSYRSTPVFQRRQDSFRADPDNVIFARGAVRDEWYARGIEAGAADLAELLALEYEVHIDPDEAP